MELCKRFYWDFKQKFKFYFIAILQDANSSFNKFKLRQVYCLHIYEFIMFCTVSIFIKKILPTYLNFSCIVRRLQTEILSKVALLIFYDHPLSDFSSGSCLKKTRDTILNVCWHVTMNHAKLVKSFDESTCSVDIVIIIATAQEP